MIWRVMGVVWVVGGELLIFTSDVEMYYKAKHKAL